MPGQGGRLVGSGSRGSEHGGVVLIRPGWVPDASVRGPHAVVGAAGGRPPAGMVAANLSKAGGDATVTSPSHGPRLPEASRGVGRTVCRRARSGVCRVAGTRSHS